MSEIHVFIDGVEICDLKESPIDLQADDWFDHLLRWVGKQGRWDEFKVITEGDPDVDPDAKLTEIWIGDLPDWKVRITPESHISCFTEQTFHGRFGGDN